MNTDQKLLLLRSATSQPFTSKSNLLSELSAQFPLISVEEIEEFFDGVVDFDAVRKWQQEIKVEQTRLAAQSAERDSVSASASAPVSVSDSISVSVSESHPSNPSSPPPSKSPSPSPVEAPKNSPSPPLVVPVRTPSGRTLRSNSTVNTSEPRRLRSNK